MPATGLLERSVYGACASVLSLQPACTGRRECLAGSLPTATRPRVSLLVQVKEEQRAAAARAPSGLAPAPAAAPAQPPAAQTPQHTLAQASAAAPTLLSAPPTCDASTRKS
jgi:hypothetical protein